MVSKSFPQPAIALVQVPVGDQGPEQCGHPRKTTPLDLTKQF
jgi:hypothetical protein